MGYYCERQLRLLRAPFSRMKQDRGLRAHAPDTGYVSAYFSSRSAMWAIMSVSSCASLRASSPSFSIVMASVSAGNWRQRSSLPMRPPLFLGLLTVVAP